MVAATAAATAALPAGRGGATVWVGVLGGVVIGVWAAESGGAIAAMSGWESMSRSLVSIGGGATGRMRGETTIDLRGTYRPSRPSNLTQSERGEPAIYLAGCQFIWRAV